MIGDQPRDGVSERVACVSFALLKGVGLVIEVEAMPDLDDGGVGCGVHAEKVKAFEAVEGVTGPPSFGSEYQIGGDACHGGVCVFDVQGGESNGGVGEI